MIRLIVFISIFYQILNIPLFAQDLTDDIEGSANLTATIPTEESQDILVKNCSNKIKQLYEFISLMSDKNLSISERELYKKAALDLFINSGNSYILDSIQKEGVYINITNSKYHNRARPQLLKHYFDSIIRNGYSNIQIEAVEIAEINVESLRKNDNNEYECICTISQTFCGFKNSKPVYHDLAPKHVKYHFNMPDFDSTPKTILLFGDVYATVIQ